MVQNLTRLVRRLRRKKSVGIGLLVLLLAGSIVGNALTFYAFDRSVRPDQPDLSIGDAFWYSIVSITTIGYGDISPISTGARIGTAIFIMVLGLAAFTSAVGIGVDWILERQYKGRRGMGKVDAKNHLLIINFPNERRVRQVFEEFLRDPRHRHDEIVIVTDQIESMPFDLPSLFFVRGSTLEEETYLRANVKKARQAIILSTGYDDPNSDSVAASIVSILEHLNPEIRSVAEVLNAKHSLLFRGANNASLVYTFRMSNNMIVQEAQDPGSSILTQAIISNQQVDGGALISTSVDSSVDTSLPYIDVARALLQHDVNLVGIIRGENVHLSFENIALTRNDRLVYICPVHHDWPKLRSFLGPT